MTSIERIIDLIAKSGKTDYAVKKEIGLPNSSLSEWRAGRAKPSADALSKLADYFNVSVDYLLGRTEIMWTAEDYANGVIDTKKVGITADEEELLDVFREIGTAYGETVQATYIDMGRALLSNKKFT